MASLRQTIGFYATMNIFEIHLTAMHVLRQNLQHACNTGSSCWESTHKTHKE